MGFRQIEVLSLGEQRLNFLPISVKDLGVGGLKSICQKFFCIFLLNPSTGMTQPIQPRSGSLCQTAIEQVIGCGGQVHPECRRLRN
jgi:hypothetical protein